jgi:hypothetical protein
MEIIVRLAQDKYIKSGNIDMIDEAVQTIWDLDGIGD